MQLLAKVLGWILVIVFVGIFVLTIFKVISWRLFWFAALFMGVISYYVLPYIRDKE